MNQIVHEISQRQDQIQIAYSDRKTLDKKINTQKELINDEYLEDSEYSEVKEQLDIAKKKMKEVKQRLDETEGIFAMLQTLDELKAERKDVDEGIGMQLELFTQETKQGEIVINNRKMKIVKKFELKNK